MDPQASLSSRRRSVRDHKGPLGPRPPDFSPSKRVTSDTSSFVVPGQPRTNLPNTTSEPFLGLSARRNASASEAFKDNRPRIQTQTMYQKSSAPSQPVFNTQQATLSQEPSLEDFPRPGGMRQGKRDVSAKQLKSPNRASDLDTPARRGLSTSPVRRQNSALRSAQPLPGSIASVPSSTGAGSKTRRQSHMPPSAVNNISAKQPRKSVGPGYAITGAKAKTVFDPASRTFIQDLPTSMPIESPVASLPASRSNAGSTPVAWAEDTSAAQTRRRDKTRSLQQAPSAFRRNGLFEEPPLPNSIPNVFAEDGTASKSGIQPLAMQQMATRRQSTAAGHVGGLGARTVSPTDVRRSRRMSVIAHTPPMPTRSPTPELTFGQRPPPTPPAVTSQSVAPSASSALADLGITDASDVSELPQRATPARSTSSRCSYTSARPSSSSSQHRPSQGSTSNRSPVIKTRAVPMTTNDETETVPPVPAIPKAYESPTDSSDRPFFQDMNARFGLNRYSQSESKETERFVTPVEELPERPSQTAPQNHLLTLNNRRDSSKDILTGTNKHTTGGRLPPLNLLPLSTPTTTRIASLSQQRNDQLPDRQTPPPYRPPPKTPSTPMTASKAMFPTFDAQTAFDMTQYPQLRSSTAYAIQRSDSSTLDGSGSESPAIFARASPATSRHGPSPFGSFSLPRLNGEMQNLVPRHSRDEAPDTTQTPGPARHSKTLSRRPSTVSRAAKDPLATGNGGVSESEGPPTGSSLRRKLSFGWRRSSSKASHQSPHLDDDYSSLSNNDMPPPKLPASATRDTTQRKSPKPSARSSQNNLSGALSTPESFQLQTHESSRGTLKNAPVGTERTLSSVRSSGSLFSMPKMLGSRSSQGTLRAQRNELPVERADAAAEEEMKKLASKRKEFEVSARELDGLQRKATAKERVSPSQASRIAVLNIFERGEIVDYRDVYFCGAKSADKFVGDLSSESTNFGFDDERGDYNIVAGDHLAYRYEVLDILGKGSFGQVVRCVDHKSGKLVAIKIIRNKKRFHQQALVEVNILQKLREWDPQNVHSMINFTQSFYFRGHLCISTELLGINLYEFIKAHDFSGFSLKLIRRFTKQMLSSLCLLQAHNVIHCDLKPENILLAHPLHSEIKTIDFGSSCFENEKVYTYIQSRFYRSPEVILGMTYGMPIDVWSLGCILAELYTGYPIFPGENEQEQLACIMEVFGPPEKHLIERSTRKKLFFDSLGKPRITVSSKGKRRRPSSKTLAQALKCDDDAFTDFITRCLRWDPDRRIKPDEAMAHEFVTGVKKSSRNRGQPNAVAPSPAKRSTMQTPSKTRQATDIPATSSKNGNASNTARESPVKGGQRRKSSMFDQQNGVKWNGVTSASALPRVAQGQRSASSKPDMASAASAAAMSSLSKANRSKNRLPI